jgi:hypothetical protein
MRALTAVNGAGERAKQDFNGDGSALFYLIGMRKGEEP